jgi:hypothetical protein
MVVTPMVFLPSDPISKIDALKVGGNSAAGLIFLGEAWRGSGRR